MQVDASSTYFGPVPCPCDLVPMGEKQEKEVFHEKNLMELDENYEEPLESKDLKSPEFSMEKADLKSPKVFSEDLDLNSPSFSMEPSMKRRKKQLGGVCVFVCALRLYPATPGWGVRCGCVCLGSGFGCAPPLLAGVLGCVCVCVRAPLVPRPSWLGCAVLVCVLWLGFSLLPAPLGWGFGVCVCVCVRAPLVPRHSWLGCAVWECVLGLAFWLRPAIPGWAVAVCVCVCVRASLVPRHSRLGCVVWLCVCRLGFLLRPATPGWGFGVCVCLCAGSACTPPLLARVFGCVCVCVRAPLVPRHSWLGCAVRVCVLGLGFRLRPAFPGWGVGVCVCLCARSACTDAFPWGAGHGTLRWTRASEQAGKALRSQGHQCAHVM